MFRTKVGLTGLLAVLALFAIGTSARADNSDDIDPARVLRRLTYEHPLFTSEAVAAQARFDEISGVGRTH